ncbi:MAG: glycosyltransferase [Acidimicrobiales bacterium]
MFGGDASPVTFLGSVDDEELTAAYARASVVITPTSHEDYGLTVLEAMAHARPEIVCRDGAASPSSSSTARTVSSSTQRPAIAAAASELRADPQRAEAMGRHGRDTVAGVTWERAVETVAAALRSTLDGGHSSDPSDAGGSPMTTATDGPPSRSKNSRSPTTTRCPAIDHPLGRTG